MELHYSVIKVILFVINVIVFVFGAASLGVGIWVAVSKNRLFGFINLIDTQLTDNSNKEQIQSVMQSSNLIMVAAYVLIAIGIITLIVGFCGSLGIILESPTLLLIYAVLIVLLLIAQVSTAVMAGTIQSRVKAKAKSMLQRIQDRYYVALPDVDKLQNTSKGMISHLINLAQVQFGCCINSKMGAASSWHNSSRSWGVRKIQRPMACCQVKDTEARKRILTSGYDWKNLPSDLKDPRCPFANDAKTLNAGSCYDSIVEYVKTYSRACIIVAVATAVVEMVSVLLGCVMAYAYKQ